MTCTGFPEAFDARNDMFLSIVIGVALFIGFILLGALVYLIFF